MKLFKALFLVIFFSFQFGKSEAQISDSIAIYPNPFDSFTIVEFSLSEQDTITVSFFNAFGIVALQPMVNQILAGGLHTININTQTLPSGIYFIKIDYGSGGYKSRRGVKAGNLTSNNSPIISKTPLVLFPNPTSDLISIPCKGLKEIHIFDATGKEWKFFKTSLNQVSLRDLPNGIYNIHVLDGYKRLIIRNNISKTDW